MRISTLASLFSVVLASPMVMANPVQIDIEVVCPFPANGMNRFDNYIAGYGLEKIQGHGNQIYFKSSSLSEKVPNKLINYRNQNVDYNNQTGNVSCEYRSMNPTEPNFSISYTLTNAKGGLVMNQTDSSIVIQLPIGK